MRAFRHHEGIVAPLRRANIDTDAIIPSREMKRVSKEGLGDGLFSAWRYLDTTTRAPNPDFVLNQPAYASASILLAGPNFGCGSSREHAVWALQEYGFRAIIAPGFGAIFERNCYNNGLLPLTLSDDLIQRIAASCTTDPQNDRLSIDLETRQIALPDRTMASIEVPEIQREMLLNGWDPIDRTLQLAEHINMFHAADRMARPWVYELERVLERNPENDA